MVLQPHRDRIAASESSRTDLLAQLDEDQPVDPLEAVAYWTRLADHARRQLDGAVLDAKRAGYSWGVVAIAHDRTAATTQRKFARMVNDAPPPSS